jgi:membrane protease YdiL (CAAX protease family)
MPRGPAITKIVGVTLFVAIAVGATGLLACGMGLCAAALPLALTLGTLTLHLAAVAALAVPSVVERLRRLLDARPLTTFVVAAGLIIPYLLYWGVPGNTRQTGLLGLMAWVAAPSAVAVAWPRDWLRTAGDALVVLLIWLPFELRWADAAYPWPPGGGGALLAVPLGLGLLVYLTTVARRIDGVGFVARLDRRDLTIAAQAFAVFALAGVPIGLLSGFLRPAHRWPGVGDVLVRAVMIFVFTALPEETCFRGLIQGLVQRHTARPISALLITSVLFGLAHLNNGPAPDWRYFLLATLAGIAYGWAFQRTGRLAAPALAHLLVDLTWSLAFKG